MAEKKYTKKNCLILEWLNLPRDLKDWIADRYDYKFRNDILMEMSSEFKPKELTLAAVQGYYKDQIARTDEHATFQGTFEEFIEEYGLKLEMWLIEQKLDLSDVDQILIKVCW